MIRSLETTRRFVIPGVLAAVILSAVSCFDMYGEVLDNADPDNYRISLFCATSSGVLLVNDGRGNLSQAPAIVIPPVGSSIISAAAADFDKDGDLDLLVVDASVTTAYLLRNNESKNFSPAGSIPININSRDIALADFNNDGKIEAYITSWNGIDQIISVDKNLIMTALTPPGSSSSGTVSAFDADNDGDMDVYLGKFNSYGPNELWLNDGHGNFILSWSGMSATNNTGDSDAGDINGDGYTDIIEANEGFGVTVRLSNGHGSFSTDFEYLITPASLGRARLGDLDGDGDLDAFVTWETNATKNKILINNGKGNFTAGECAFPGEITNNSIICDIDSDFDNDVIIAADGNIKLMINDGNGNFTYIIPGIAIGANELIPGVFIK